MGDKPFKDTASDDNDLFWIIRDGDGKKTESKAATNVKDTVVSFANIEKTGFTMQGADEKYTIQLMDHDLASANDALTEPAEVAFPTGIDAGQERKCAMTLVSAADAIQRVYTVELKHTGIACGEMTA